MSVSTRGDLTVAINRDASILRAYPARVTYVLVSVAMVAVVLGGAGSGVFGVDFGVFYVGGALIASDGYEAAYQSSTFTEVLTDEYFPSRSNDGTIAHFISTPPFGWFAQALSWFPFAVSLTVWLAIGAILIPASVRLLDLPMWVSAAVFVSPAMTFNTLIGQTGPFVLILFVLLHRAVASGRLVRAGLLAGLLILKPPLAFGYGLLWLIQFRRYRTSILMAAISGVVVSIPTLVGGLSPWRAFLDAMIERSGSEGVWYQTLSISESLKLLAPHSSAGVTVAFWLVGLLGGGYVLIIAQRHYGSDPEVMSAVAVVAAVLAAPHLLIYDSFVLVIPLAVAYRRGLLVRERAALLAAIHAVSITLGRSIYFAQHDVFGGGLSVEFLALLVSCWLLIRWSRQETGEPESLVPALADA